MKDHAPAGALLVLDGELPSKQFIHNLRPDHQLLIAADGAALRLHAIEIIPDIVIGDMDSMGTDHALFQSESVMLVHKPDQESNDFEKGLQWILEQNLGAVTILGIGGGMLDHTLNNFSILAKYATDLTLTIRDERSTGVVVIDQFALSTNPGERISLIPLPKTNLTTTGLEWELEEEDLQFAVREGASNRTTGTQVQLTIHSGIVLVLYYPQ